MSARDPKETVKDKREEQRQRLIDAAEQLLASQGLGHLKARALAAHVGIALGQIYNLVGDMDEIIVRVNSRTIARLEALLEQQAVSNASHSAQEKLIAVALSYHHFAREHYHLWHALFDHQPAIAHKKISALVSHERRRPFRLIEQLLQPLCPDMSGQDLRIFAQTVFSSVHGIIVLALDARDVGVPKAQLDAQLRLYLTLLCRGLESHSRSTV